MEHIIEFLMYLVVNHGIWSTIVFILVSIIPSVAIIYIIFSKSALGKFIDIRLSEQLEKEKQAHLEGNRIRKQFTEEVQDILTELATSTGADRALVFEYSNGTSNLVGLPFLFTSAAAEVVTANTPRVSHTYQRINLSIAAEFLVALEKEGAIYIEDLSKVKDQYPMLTHFMLPNGVKSALFYSLEGVDEPIGFIVITTTIQNGKTLTKSCCLHDIARAAQRIGAMLNFNELKKQSDKKDSKKKWFKLW